MGYEKPKARIHYEATREQIDEQLDAIAYRLRQHNAKSGNSPADWGYEGDLLEVRAKLAEVIAWLGGD